MNFFSRVFGLLSLCFALVCSAEEAQSPLNTALSSTTLTGFVDTSSAWWLGVQGSPANDNFADAQLLTERTNTISGTTAGASLEPGEPATNVVSVWYRWTAPTTGRARISSRLLAPVRPPAITATMPSVSDEPIFYPWGGFGLSTNGGTFGSVIEIITPLPPLILPTFAVFSGDRLEVLTQIASAQGYVEFEALSGSTYMLAVQRYSNILLFGQDFTFYTDISPRALNDDFANAFDLGDVSAASFNGVATPSTLQPGEPAPPFAEDHGSVWVHWKAPAYGRTTLTVNAPAAVFRGTAITDLRLVTTADFSNAGTFFAEEGIDYWIAFYGFPYMQEYSATLQGPQYRLFETTMDQIMPAGSLPYFYGLRGQTAFLYAKSAAGWTPVEVEAIKDYGCSFVIRPDASLNGALRVTTIDDSLPSPHVSINQNGTAFTATLEGFPGQTCFVSKSQDLVSWSEPTTITLHARTQDLGSGDLSNASFYRVVQAYAQLNVPPVQIEPPH